MKNVSHLLMCLVCALTLGSFTTVAVAKQICPKGQPNCPLQKKHIKKSTTKKDKLQLNKTDREKLQKHQLKTTSSSVRGQNTARIRGNNSLR